MSSDKKLLDTIKELYAKTYHNIILRLTRHVESLKCELATLGLQVRSTEVDKANLMSAATNVVGDYEKTITKLRESAKQDQTLILLLKAGQVSLGSLLLDVQQDCIKANLENTELKRALVPLANIAAMYSANGLDEARPNWHKDNDAEAALISGRGGGTLLTLQDAINARQAIIGARPDREPAQAAEKKTGPKLLIVEV